MTPKLIITIILGCAILFFLIAWQVVRKIHRSDPEFMKRQQEREAAYRQKQMEDMELDDQLQGEGFEEDIDNPSIRKETTHIYREDDLSDVRDNDTEE